MNSLQFQCPKCQKLVSVSAEKAGFRIGCPACTLPILVPGMRTRVEPTLEELLDLSGEIGENKSSPATQAKDAGNFEKAGAEDELLSLSKDDYIAGVEESINHGQDDSVLELPEESEVQLAPLPSADDAFDVAPELDEHMQSFPKPGIDDLGDLGAVEATPLDFKDQPESTSLELVEDDDDVKSTLTAMNDEVFGESDVQLIEDDLLDDLVDLDKPVKAHTTHSENATTLAELTVKNPFEHDEFAPLSIDGITLPDNAIMMACPVCGTRISAMPSEVGSKKKCPDCYSMIEVVVNQRGLLHSSDQPDGTKGYSSGNEKNRNHTPAIDRKKQVEHYDDDDELKLADDEYSLAPLDEIHRVDTRFFTGSDDPLKDVECQEPEQRATNPLSQPGSVEMPDYDLPDSYDTERVEEQAVFVSPIEDEDDDVVKVLPETPIDFRSTSNQALKSESGSNPSSTRSNEAIPVQPIDESNDVSDDLFGDDLFGDSKKKDRK